MAITTSGTSITFNDSTVQSTAAGAAYLKAFVNFQGSTGTIRRSLNTSSVTRVSAGLYNMNWTTAIGNSNYIVTAASQAVGGDYQAQVPMQLGYSGYTTTPIQSANCYVCTLTNRFTVNDSPICCASVYTN